MPATTTPSPPRLPAVDALRGFIMVVMALDHTRAFVAREHPFEFWGTPLPEYTSALPFVTRLVTHLCAPGFFFLMGVGMALLAAARRPMGWSEGRIAGYFVRRGIVLLLVEQLLENPAWIIGSLGAAQWSSDSFTPSGPAPVFGVLFALAMAMIAWAPLMRLPTAAITAVSAAAILATQILTPPIAEANTAFSPLLRLLLVPGHTGILFVMYPIVPWMGMTGL